MKPKSYLILSIKVDGSPIHALSKAKDLILNLDGCGFYDITVLNTIPAPK